MSLKTFFIGMFASFGLAWMCMIAIPVAKTSARTPVKMNAEDDAAYYQHGVSGRILNGAEIYNANGCYTCHTQLIRPDYAGTEVWRKEGTAGRYHENQGENDPVDDIDTRRETNIDDYTGEKYANIGLMRMGPDLSNVGYRAESYGAKVNLTGEQWLLEHLFNPRNNHIRIGTHGEKLEMKWSICPAQRQMFEETPANGQNGFFAIIAPTEDGQIMLPKEDAHVLASYLLSLKRDDVLPASLSHAPTKEEE